MRPVDKRHGRWRRRTGGTHSPLGERLRQERDRLGLSLRELARRLDVSPSLVSQIETGKIQPSVRTLYAMVSELGVSLDEMFAPRGRRRAAAGRRAASTRRRPVRTRDRGDGGLVQRAGERDA